MIFKLGKTISPRHCQRYHSFLPYRHHYQPTLLVKRKPALPSSELCWSVVYPIPVFLTRFFVFYCDIFFNLTSEIHLHSDFTPLSSSASSNVCKNIWKGPLILLSTIWCISKGERSRFKQLKLHPLAKLNSCFHLQLSRPILVYKCLHM